MQKSLDEACEALDFAGLFARSGLDWNALARAGEVRPALRPSALWAWLPLKAARVCYRCEGHSRGVAGVGFEVCTGVSGWAWA